MTAAVVMTYLVGGVLAVISLTAAAFGLYSTMRNPSHPWGRALAVGLAKWGFACCLASGVLHLGVLAVGMVARFATATTDMNIATGVLGFLGTCGGILGAVALILLAFSVAEFMKLGAGEKH